MAEKGAKGLLGICRRAGKLRMGMDMAKAACESGEAKAVFVCTDISAKSLKEVTFHCERCGVKLCSLGMTMDETAEAIGRRTGILAVTDGGFAKALAKGLTEIESDR